jgi:hypothetical protein
MDGIITKLLSVKFGFQTDHNPCYLITKSTEHYRIKVENFHAISCIESAGHQLTMPQLIITAKQQLPIIMLDVQLTQQLKEQDNP